MSGCDNCVRALVADNAVYLSGKGRLCADIKRRIKHANHKRPARNNGASSKLFDVAVHLLFKPDPVGNYVQRTVFIGVGSGTPLINICGIGQFSASVLDVEPVCVGVQIIRSQTVFVQQIRRKPRRIVPRFDIFRSAFA